MIQLDDRKSSGGDGNTPDSIQMNRCLFFKKANKNTVNFVCMSQHLLYFSPKLLWSVKTVNSIKENIYTL